MYAVLLACVSVYIMVAVCFLLVASVDSGHTAISLSKHRMFLASNIYTNHTKIVNHNITVKVTAWRGKKYNVIFMCNILYSCFAKLGN